MSGTKTAFFDIDGTLAAPVFQKDGRPVAGLDDEEWRRYWAENPEDGYAGPVVEAVVAFAIRLLAAGWRLKILAGTRHDAERGAKLAWLEGKGIDRMFDEVVFVDGDEGKMRYLRDHIARTDASPSDCLLVEDNYYNVLEAGAIGMRAAHVAHVVTGVADELAGLASQ